MFKSFPRAQQLDSKDCGPACLKIILKHFGRHFTLPHIREKCGISREGVSFYDLASAAEHLQLRARCYNVSFDQLVSKIPLPCIVHWNNNHFVVVYRIKRNTVYISDPTLGLVKYSRQEFIEYWAGNDSKGKVIVALPTTEFHADPLNAEMPDSTRIFKILKYFEPYKGNIINLLVVILLITFLQGILPFISRAVIDVGIQTGDIDFINIVLVANLAIIFAMLIGNSVREWILLHVSSRVNVAMVSEYLAKMMKLPMSFFETKLTGDLLQRVQDHDRVRSFITDNAINLVFASLTFIVFSAILLIFNPVIFLMFIIGNIFYILWVFGFISWRKKLDWESFEITSRNQSYWVETISAMQDIKVNNYEVQRRWDWEKIQAKQYKVNQRVLTLNNVQHIGVQFLTSVTNLVITFYCAKAVIKGEISFGVMISTQFMIGMLSNPITQMMQYVQSLQYAKISYQRLSEVHLMKGEQSPDEINNLSLPVFKAILLRNVSFRYSANSPLVLNNVSLIVPEKLITAIVGDSGSGKSTLLKLILRLYEPTFGEISIGNSSLKNVDIQQWRAKCACVLQDGKIFNDTVLKNIVLGDQDIDYERLKKCVAAANIDKEIEEMSQGYKTMLGEMGQGISGGQKQRLLIARALYKDPEYLLMDEATNSLDTVNELKIVEALDQIFHDKTVVIVAHRLSTIRRAHQIIVMKDGSIVEVGNHDSLMSNNGHYRKLINAQLTPEQYA